MGYLYIAGTISCVVYSQLIIKWRVSLAGALPAVFREKVFFLMKLLIDPFVLSGFIAAFIGALLWMLTLTKFELSHAYPIIIGGLAILTSIFAVILFHESLGFIKIAGLILVMIGMVFLSRG